MTQTPQQSAPSTAATGLSSAPSGASSIDYYFAPQSPWSYLGHARFVQMAAAAQAKVRVLPIDLGRVCPVSGGLPLAKRPPQRQAYRLVELARFSSWLDVPMHVQPQHFPVPGDDAARLIIAADMAHGSSASLALTGRVMAAVWAEQRNVADGDTLAALLQQSGLPADLLDAARNPAVQALYDDYTQQAIASNVFGAPTYVVAGEMFWGQVRLDFVERRLKQPRWAPSLLEQAAHATVLSRHGQPS